MARQSGRQSVGRSLKTLFVELASIAIILSVVYFVTQVMEMKAVEQYMEMFNITRNASQPARYDLVDSGGSVDVSTDITAIRSGYVTAKSILTLALGLLGLIMVILVFAGYLLPVVQSIF